MSELLADQPRCLGTGRWLRLGTKLRIILLCFSDVTLSPVP